MWNDDLEDNNPYGSVEGHDSDTGGDSSPTSRKMPSAQDPDLGSWFIIDDDATGFQTPATPPEQSSPVHAPTNLPTRIRGTSDDDDDDDEDDGARGEPASRKRGGYDSRVEQMLYENASLVISITHAGKNMEGGGSYIVYTIRTGEIEVRRRYSDFYSLRQTLVSLHPTLIVPPIPEKHSMADYAARPTKAKEDEVIIEHRKRMLTSFLNRCRRMRDVVEDGVFWKFLDPNASWSEVMHSHPISALPKNVLKAPPLDPANPTPGHNFLPVPSTNAKLKTVAGEKTASGTPTTPTAHSQLPSAAAHTTPSQQMQRFPPSSKDLSESDLDPYFVSFETSSRDLEQLLQGSMEKINKRTLSHLTSYSDDLAELGARLNGFSLSEQSPTLAAAIEKIGQAVDSTYIATADLSSSLEAGFAEPMRESAQFAGIVKSVLRFRILKRVQEEMTRDELEKKRIHLDQLERSELEAQRIQSHLSSSGYLNQGDSSRRAASFSSGRNSSERARPEEDSASIDSDFPSRGGEPPSAAQGTPQQQRNDAASPTHKKNASGNFVTNKIFGRLNYALQGFVDADPERTRRDQIGKTRESLVQLEQALKVSETDVKDASAGVLKSLKEFQGEKEEDLRRYMLAYARCHIDWAKRNLASWEEAKAEVDKVDAALATTSFRNKKPRLSYGSKARRSGPERSFYASDEDPDLSSNHSRDSPVPTALLPAAHQPAQNSLLSAYSHVRARAQAALQSNDLQRGPPTTASPDEKCDEVMTGGDDALPAGDSNNRPNSGQGPAASVSFAESNLRSLGLDARASSPLKRTRSDRDETGEHMNGQEDSDGAGASARSPKKTTSQHTSPIPNRFKPMNEELVRPPGSPLVDMRDVNSAHDRSEQSATISEDSNGFRADGNSSNESTNVSSPPTSVDDESKSSPEPDYDAQYENVKSIVERNPLKEGMKGFVVPATWITRVQSRTTSGLSENHPKSFREGPVGPVPTWDIAIKDAGVFKDSKGQPFVPLKSGLSPDTDCVVLPEPGWKLIREWYGIAEGHPEIVRYAHDTSPDSSRENVMWELYPPICTIRKLRKNNETLSIEAMRERDAPSECIVTSRQEKFQSFLHRAKTAAGISQMTQTRVWKSVEALPTSTGLSNMPTPASSRANSPAPSSFRPAQQRSLLLDLSVFASWPESQRELIDIEDELGALDTSDTTLIDTIGLSENQQLVLEEQERDSSGRMGWIMESVKSAAASHGVEVGASKGDLLSAGDALRSRANIGASRRSPTPSGMMTRGRSNKKKKVGAVGLQNLGNTCYMNSALQCIRSVKELTVYFLMEAHVREINMNNPIGHRGQIAKSYSSLVHSLYQSTQSFSPRVFKSTLGKCEPLFSGYGQQDSQEFLSFLIDGLHEDLNRVLKKPATENPDCDDEKVRDPAYVEELGEEYRRIHRLRNDSVAMDLFNGFYKNTIVCPVCDKVSVTFDPYSALTLQLPIENLWSHDVMFVPLTGTPVVVDVEMSKNNNIKTLKQYVGGKVSVETERMIMAEVYQEKLYKIFEDNEFIAELNITNADLLVIYELDHAPTNWPPAPEKARKKNNLFSSISSRSNVPDMTSGEAKFMAVPVLNRVAGSGKGVFKNWPTFILLSREEAKDYELILRKILRRIEMMTTREMFTEGREQKLKSQQVSEKADDVESTASDEQKVQANSIDSEDGLVDVSMADNNEMATSTHSILTSPLADPTYYIDPKYRDLFEMKVYGPAGEDLIPSGFSAIGDHQTCPSLASRIIQHPEDRPFTPSDDGSAANNSSESDDELHRDDAVDMTRGNYGRRSSDSSTSSEATNLDGTPLGRQYVARKQKPAVAETDPQEGYLVRLGEGIVLDWNLDAYDGLFGGEVADDMRGTSTLTDAGKLPDPELKAKRERRQARRKNGVSLDDCFEESSKTEILSEDNAWYCSTCKEHRRASKTLEIWTVPDILVVHLKRFASQSRMRDKIEVFVDFPIEGLDLDGRVGLPEDKSLTYDLFAVDNHYGGLGGGHYTATTRNFEDGNWYEYNDSFVSKTTSDRAVTKSAYLLFYRRRADASLGPPYLREIVERAYAPSSRPASPSGEDQANDDSSPNGSSTDSHAAAVARPLGLAPKAGSGDPAGATKSGPRVRTMAGIGPSSYDEDEGISMVDSEHDPDNPLPSYEDAAAEPPAIAMPHAQNWDFSHIQETSPAASSNEAMGDGMSDRNLSEPDMAFDADADDTALIPLGRDESDFPANPPSPAPMHADSDTEMQEMGAFAEVRTTGRRRKDTFEHVASLGHDIEDSGDELPVAEVRVGEDDEGA